MALGQEESGSAIYSEAVALIEIHGRPIGYSTSKSALERSAWIGHRIQRMTTVPGWAVDGTPFRHDAPHYEAIHGVERVVWPVVTACGQKISVTLEPDWGYAEARDCERCAKSKTVLDGVLLVEVMPPMRRAMTPKPNRRQRGISAAEAF